jgi:hypothetical protein
MYYLKTSGIFLSVNFRYDFLNYLNRGVYAERHIIEEYLLKRDFEHVLTMDEDWTVYTAINGE